MGTRTRIPALLDTPTAAEVLGVTPRTLESWRTEGRGPSYLRLGHHTVRYDLNDVLAWLRERREAS